MSYDIDIGGSEVNCTYNVSNMFYDWMPDKGIRTIYGLTGQESIEVLRSLREHLENNRLRMLEMEPGNGWGSLKNTHALINKMVMLAISYPNEIWAGD